MKKILMIAISIALFSCGTNINGDRQDLFITSNPTGAKIRINYTDIGTTPLLIRVKKKNVKIEIYKDDYLSFFHSPKLVENGWVYGNLLQLNLIGFVADYYTGGAYEWENPTIKTDLVKIKKDKEKVKEKRAKRHLREEYIIKSSYLEYDDMENLSKKTLDELKKIEKSNNTITIKRFKQ